MSVELIGASPIRSYSSFTTYLYCGKQWELARKLKVPESPAFYFAGGEAVHTVTEIFDKHLEGWSDAADE